MDKTFDGLADRPADKPAVVLDTNVFVAAGFRGSGVAAGVLELVRDGRLRHVWHVDTARETRAILGMVPRLSWVAVESLFRAEDRFDGPLMRDLFLAVDDPADRKFAALAAAAQAVLITSDKDLLSVREKLSHLGVTVIRPSQVRDLL